MKTWTIRSRFGVPGFGIYDNPRGFGVPVFVSDNRDTCELLRDILNCPHFSSQRLGTLARKFSLQLNRIET